jgi:RNA polymerase sigma factor (sigma-70 family)
MGKGKLTDEEIVNGILSQNTEVLKFVYENNFKSVKKHIEDNNGSESDAQDIFQDILILLFNKIRNNELTLTCSFNTYLMAIAKTQWLNILRKRKKIHIPISEQEHLLECDEDLNEKLIQAEKERLITQYLGELPKECKKIMDLILNGSNLIEITDQMGYNSVQHTKNKKLKCKKNLISKIMSNPRFKELADGKCKENNSIPRW